ncbi:MAG: histidine kinase [Lapillicoccus sp.]
MTVSPDRPPADPVATYERRFSLWAAVGAGVWLIFLAPAVQEGWRERGAFVGWVGILSTVAFATAYMVAFFWARPHRRVGGSIRVVTSRTLVISLLLYALGAAMVLSLHSTGLGAAVYISVAGVMMFPVRWSLPQAVVLASGSELLARTQPGWDGAEGIGLSVGLATFAVWGIWQAMRRSMDLVRAKEENTELLVGQERARMARDLHDILGHSLTVVIVKAELAGRLLDAEASPDADADADTGGGAGRGRARAEVADIERLARDALADVRRTVEGYRDLSLPVEISRAKAALEAAEIEATLPGSTDEVPSEFRELFAWIVREGVTNVVRHSAARHCTVSLGPDRVRIVDDGRGCVGVDGGHGLVGLRERAAASGARLVVESPTGGGFSLSVFVPVRAAPAPPLPEVDAIRAPTVTPHAHVEQGGPVGPVEQVEHVAPLEHVAKLEQDVSS